MQRSFRAFEYICTLLVQFLILYIVVVVEWSTSENPLLYAFLLAFFEVCNLQNYRHVLCHEYAAEQNKQNLLVQQNGYHANNAAYGKASGISHEDLCRK